MKLIPLTLCILLMANPVEKSMLRAVKEDLKSYAADLGVKLAIKTKVVKSDYCNRYSAWGIYFNSPIQSYYYRKCLERFEDKKADLNHAITPPFLYNGVPSGGGYASKCVFDSRSISVSAWVSTNYLGSVIAIFHEALGHNLGADHIEKMCTMHPAAAGYKYTALCEETKKQVYQCIK